MTPIHLDTLVVYLTDEQLREIRAGRTQLLGRLVLASCARATGLESLLAGAAGVRVEHHREVR